MNENSWTRWPSREALSREGVSRPRRLLAQAIRVVLLGLLLWAALSQNHASLWGRPPQ